MTESSLQEDGHHSEGDVRSVDQRAAMARAMTVARWHEAEARIYPLVMTEPNVYEAAVRAVGLVSTQLRIACRERADVVALSDDDIVEIVAADPRTAEAVHASPLGVGLLCDAARAQTFALLPDASSINS